MHVGFSTVVGFWHLLGILEVIATNKGDEYSCVDQNIGLTSFWMQCNGS